MIKFFSKRLRNKKGFTIVELLVVIALLGILAGIAVPRMTGLTQTARVNADRASVATVARDAQVAVATGQISTDSTTAVDIFANGVTNEYWTAQTDLPTSQAVDGGNITVTIQNNGNNTFTIVVTNGGTGDTLATETIVVEDLE